MSTKNHWGKDGSLEMKLLQMPFEKMVDAIASFDELDELLFLKIEEEKPELLDQEREKIFIRREKRMEFIAFRVALENELPVRSFELPSGLTRIIPPPPTRNIGMELCAIGMADIFMNSKTERIENTIRYSQDGRLRAVVGLVEEMPHGSFEVFYPDGKIWMLGAYEKGRMVSESMSVYMPDGSLLKPTPPPDNVTPIFKSN